MNSHIPVSPQEASIMPPSLDESVRLTLPCSGSGGRERETERERERERQTEREREEETEQLESSVDRMSVVNSERLLEFQEKQACA
eukprot:COSAG02_NODE_6691_length_3419_cov_1.999699_1_plen_86_part_00